MTYELLLSFCRVHPYYSHDKYLCTCSSSPHLSMNILNILSFLDCSFMAPQSPLCKLVDSFIGSSTRGFDHIQDATFVWCKTSNFTSNAATKLCALTTGLYRKEEGVS